MGDTIFALSSGALPAAIAIVRISGPAAGHALAALGGSIPEPRRATLRALRDASGELLDRALILWFPGPDSATGEDLAELHLHGGRAVVAAVLNAISAFPDCRMAQAGEFTRRAFINGRLDLAEAEGLADLLQAETEAGRRQALRMAEGGLSRIVEGWRLRLLDLGARAEAVLEFGDDEGDVVPDPKLREDIAALADDLAEAMRGPPAERLRDGFRVVVAGPPNSGKSSLINHMAGREACIVTDLPGTTRDLIELPLDLGGMPVLLIDSAGLRDTDDPVERIGIERALSAVAAADAILWLGEPEDAPMSALRVHARADLPERRTSPSASDVSVSAKTGAGLGEMTMLLSRTLAELARGADGILLNHRHRGLALDCIAALSHARSAELPELVAEALRVALRTLHAIVGRSDVEAMLDTLFGRFCIGK